MSKNIKVNKDGFVWLIVDRSKWVIHSLYWDKYFELYVLHADDTESLVESHDDIESAFARGSQIGIEVGRMEELQEMLTQYEKNNEKL